MAKQSRPSRGAKKSSYSAATIEAEKLDLDPDAWPKFEKLIREAAKAAKPVTKKRSPT